MMNNQKTFIAFLVIFLSLNAAAFSKAFSLALTPYTAIEYGVFQEAYYYDDFSEYSDKMCSLLEWEQKPAVVLGLESTVQYKKCLFLLDASTKLPLRCGSMMDSDYWYDGLKFNYSINENYLDKAFSVRTSFSYRFDLPFLSIQPSVAVSYSFISFNAKNGYGWYGGFAHSSDGKIHSWDSPYAHYYPDGKYHLAGVDYENQSVCILVGFDVSKTFFKRWNVGVGFFVAPFTYTYVKDHHLGKSSNFYSEDFIYNYFRNFTVMFENDFAFSDRFALISVFEGNLQLLTKGENYFDGYPNSQKGGFSYKGLKIKVGISIYF